MTFHLFQVYIKRVFELVHNYYQGTHQLLIRKKVLCH